MTKRIFAILFSLLLILGTALSASAAPRVTSCADYEDLVPYDAQKEINDKANKLSDKYDCDVVIITYGVETGTSHQTIDQRTQEFLERYSRNSKGCILLVVSEDVGEYRINAKGYGMDALSTKGLEYIDKQISPDLKDGNYADAFNDFVDICEKYLSYYNENGKVYKPFDFSYTWILIALGSGIVIAFIAVFIMKSQLKSVRYQSAAGNYLVDGSFNLTLERDIYLYSTVKKVAKPKQESNSSSGNGVGGKL